MTKVAFAAIALATARLAMAQESTTDRAMPATTQSATAPTSQPATQTVADPERYLDRLLRAKPGMARPLQPVPPEEATAEPRITPRKPTTKASPDRPVKRDGDAISDRTGYLERAPDSQAWQYAFESAQAGMVDPPMILVPNSKLAAMEDAQQRAGESVRFRVSGLITAYEGQNYLLVESAREWPTVDTPGAEPAMQESGPQAAPVKPAGDIASSTTEPAALPAPVTQPVDPESTLAQLLRPRPKMARPLEVPESETTAAPEMPGIAPDIPPSPPRREGEMVVQRVGRLQPRGTAHWGRFVFEADDRGMADPPMLIIPNQRLAQMESAIEKGGIDLRFSVTGAITTYQGRNYLLIEKAQLVTDHEGL